MQANIVSDNGTLVAVLPLDPKTFSTGNKGFYAHGKVIINGVKYQAQCQLVKIKPQPEGKK